MNPRQLVLATLLLFMAAAFGLATYLASTQHNHREQAQMARALR